MSDVSVFFWSNVARLFAAKGFLEKMGHYAPSSACLNRPVFGRPDE
jgi:hypothetical protein